MPLPHPKGGASFEERAVRNSHPPRPPVDFPDSSRFPHPVVKRVCLRAMWGLRNGCHAAKFPTIRVRKTGNLLPAILSSSATYPAKQEKEPLLEFIRNLQPDRRAGSERQPWIRTGATDGPPLRIP